MIGRRPPQRPANTQVSGLVRGVFRLIGSLHHHDARLDPADAACAQRLSRRDWADLQGEPRRGRSTPAGVPGARQRELTLIFPRSISAQEAQRRSAVDGRPVVFWRPGCKYCIRLRIRLGRSARQLHWVNIWRDPAGAAAVRAANDGNETVPTLVVAGQPHTNPDPEWVREQLSPSA